MQINYQITHYQVRFEPFLPLLEMYSIAFADSCSLAAIYCMFYKFHSAIKSIPVIKCISQPKIHFRVFSPIGAIKKVFSKINYS